MLYFILTLESYQSY